MSEEPPDYLWDRSGPPDLEVARLETLLSGLGHNSNDTWRRPATRLRWALLALAAMLVLSLGVILYEFDPRGESPAPRIVVVEGTPRVGSRAIGGDGRWAAGSQLETDDRSRARIELAGLGQVDVSASSRVTFVGAPSGVYRLRLDQGEIQAFISAPAGRFVVETPSSLAVDLGCSFFLEVDESGESVLRVTSGLVALAGVERESLIPAGFVCATLAPGVGCTPFVFDAPRVLQDALQAIDLHGSSPYGLGDALMHLVHEARERDAVTLWHLLTRVSGPDRAMVYDRLAQLSPPPDNVSREGILSGDRAMLDRWWNTFGYGAIEMWRTLSYRIVPANK
jgi:hypothetical protein